MEWLAWLISASAAIPMLKLLPHFGIAKGWALVCIVPLGVILLVWMMGMKLQEIERL